MLLNYEIHDNNSENWIVFIHGIGGSTKTWKRQIEAFSQYNLLMIDLPGHGKSQENVEITINNINDKIKDVLDYLGIIKADFVCLSLGSLVVAHFAIKHTEYIKSIIFGGSIIRVDGIYKMMMNMANAIKSIVPYRLLFNIFAHVLLPKKNHKKSRKIFIRESLKMKRQNFLSWVKYMTEITHPDNLLKKLKKTNIKMFFISGDEDFCFIKGAKQVANYLQKSRIEIIEKCGHVCSIEKYNEFNEKALKFLKSNNLKGLDVQYV